jgi:hypothetical protein
MSDHHVADFQMSGQLAFDPMGGAARCVARVLQNSRFHLRCEYRRQPAQMPTVETRDALLSESLTPTASKPRLHSIGSEASSHVWSSASSKTSRVRQADGVGHDSCYSSLATVTTVDRLSVGDCRALFGPRP